MDEKRHRQNVKCEKYRKTNMLKARIWGRDKHNRLKVRAKICVLIYSCFQHIYRSSLHLYFVFICDIFLFRYFVIYSFPSY